MEDERPETLYSFSSQNEGPTQEVTVSFEGSYLMDVLFEFNNFLSASGFSYVSEVAAIYEDGSGLTSEGVDFDHIAEDEESDE